MSKPLTPLSETPEETAAKLLPCNHRQGGWCDPDTHAYNWCPASRREDVAAAIRAAVEAERERCLAIIREERLR